jgi:hypothetical protein
LQVTDEFLRTTGLRGDRNELELTIDGVKQIAGPGLTRPVSFAWPVELPTPNVALAHSKLNNGFRYWGQDPVPYFQVFYETHYLYYAV